MRRAAVRDIDGPDIRATPLWHHVAMSRPSTPGTTVEFSHAARLLGREARRRQLVAPSFRCPPRVVGAQRTVRRHSGGVVVAVQLRDRPWLAVLADMIEGVVVANQLQPPTADRLRTELWQVVAEQWPVAIAPVGKVA